MQKGDRVEHIGGGQGVVTSNPRREQVRDAYETFTVERVSVRFDGCKRSERVIVDNLEKVDVSN